MLVSWWLYKCTGRNATWRLLHPVGQHEPIPWLMGRGSSISPFFFLHHDFDDVEIVPYMNLILSVMTILFAISTGYLYIVIFHQIPREH